MIEGKDCIGVGCGALIINDNNELLLVKRNSNCRNLAGYWTIPGGGVERYETVQEAVVREIKEETGVDARVLKFLALTNDISLDRDEHWVGLQFLCEIVSGEPQNIENHKHDEVRWFSLDHLPDRLTQPVLDGIEVFKRMYNV